MQETSSDGNSDLDNEVNELMYSSYDDENELYYIHNCQFHDCIRFIFF